MLPIIPLLFDSYDTIHPFLKKSPSWLSEFTFTNLYAWQQKRQVYYLTTDNTLLLFTMNNAGQLFLFGPPFGDNNPLELLGKIIPHISGAERIPLQTAALLKTLGMTIHGDHNNADYVYRVDDLCLLRGRKYAKKRNKIKQCLKEYTCTYEKITPDTLAACRSMQDTWCDIRGCREEPGLEGEYQAIIATLDKYQDLPIIGGAIRVNGSICAFAVAEKLHEDTAVWHFEKALPGMEGLGQLITHWFAKNSLSEFTYVNREQDLGIAGLRQAKESYYPCFMVPKFTGCFEVIAP